MLLIILSPLLPVSLFAPTIYRLQVVSEYMLMKPRGEQIAAKIERKDANEVS